MGHSTLLVLNYERRYNLVMSFSEFYFAFLHNHARSPNFSDPSQTGAFNAIGLGKIDIEIFIFAIF